MPSLRAAPTHPHSPSRCASAGGCDFAVDPALEYTDAAIFWLPIDDTSVVILAAAPDELTCGNEGPGLARIAQLFAEQGREARTSLANGDILQLQFANDAPLPVVAVIPLDLDGFDRLEAVHRLLATLHSRAIPPDTRLTRQQRTRARRMLQAFDGTRDGATQQDIAHVLFRTGRVSRHEWQASAARHAVTGLLRDARAMIAGGYLKLLKHRRRS